jgi:hypothetical protein
MDRLHCQIISLPLEQGLCSGRLFKPAGSLTFSKCVFGMDRERRKLPRSRAGERNERTHDGMSSDNAVDMGPAMLLEWTLQSLAWDPRDIFRYVDVKDDKVNGQEGTCFFCLVASG